MSNQLQLIQNTAQKLGDYFDDELMATQPNYEQLHQRLTECVVYLLIHNMERLLQILYRVDVDEKLTKAAFAQNNPQQIAPELARLLIERELKKAETRLKYRT